MPLFGKSKYTFAKIVKKRGVPDGIWTKCEDCGQIIYRKVLEDNCRVCPKCEYHFVLSAHERIDMLLDKGSFQEEFFSLEPVDPIHFKGPKTYKEKIKEEQKITGLKDAVVTGRGVLAATSISSGGGAAAATFGSLSCFGEGGVFRSDVA